MASKKICKNAKKSPEMAASYCAQAALAIGVTAIFSMDSGQ
jgi:hypothetical protein